MAVFECRLPDFCQSRVVTVSAYIDENAVGEHDICSELGLILDYKNKKVLWNEIAISMQNKSGMRKIMTTTSDDPGDANLPNFMKRATHRLTKGLGKNTYDKHNHKDIVTRCDHLTSEQQSNLLQLFSKYKELFSGALGRVPCTPIKLKLKKDALPFYSRAYTVPKAVEHIAKEELQDLENMDVLVRSIAAEYTSPSFFRPKKDGGMRFVSDLRKLNAMLVREPFPLSVVDKVIWKMNGFTFATCLDLNRGYYHFVLDETSSKLCGIVLPWGTYCYKRLPQGLIVSNDIFQCKMAEIFLAILTM